MSELATRHCKPCEGGTPALTRQEVQKLLGEVKGWSVDADDKVLSQTFQFKNYYETMAFVNAVAWIAHRQDHHPDMEVSYKTCVVRYMTHAIGGLSDNDFICAARVDALLGT